MPKSLHTLLLKYAGRVVHRVLWAIYGPPPTLTTITRGSEAEVSICWMPFLLPNSNKAVKA